MTSTMSQRQRIVLETTATRERAEALLRGLIDARQVSERRLSELNQHDHLKHVTGRSAMDNAIETTRRMIESLNRTIGQFRDEMSAEDERVLDEALR